MMVQNSGDALKAIVERFTPERLGTGGDRLANYKVLEGPANDPAVIIASYTGRMGAAIRVLRRRPSGEFDVAAESPENWALAGNDSQVRVEDLDFDGRPEVIVYFLGGRLSTGWILKWDGATLRNLTPTTKNGDRETSLVLSPAVYDLEHKGALSIVATRTVENIGPGQQARNPAYVYRLGASGYEMQRGILGIMGFRADVDPRGNLRPFRLVADSTPPWTLRVINGDREGKNRVAGASISINNREVLGSGDLDERTEFVTKVIPRLDNVNEMTATLAGMGESYITVLVEDSTKRS
jgi:hypothetical protein